jgi:hypothetical protein
MQVLQHFIAFEHHGLQAADYSRRSAFEGGLHASPAVDDFTFTMVITT